VAGAPSERFVVRLGLMPDQPPSHTISSVGGIPTDEAFGETDVGRVLSLPTYVSGYNEALGRFRDAVRDLRPPEESFRPLFEALSWAFSIDDYWLKKRPKLRADVIFAMRYARNSVVHNWGDILDVSDQRAAGIHVTLASGGRRGGAHPSGHLVRHWCWRKLAELPLPPPDKRQGQKKYKAMFSGQLVQPTLDDLEAIFNRL
jgi:hypothetical protein